MTNREANPWSSDFYTNDQLGKFTEAINKFIRAGQPENKAKIEAQMQAFVPFNEIVMPDAPQSKTLKPETKIDPELVEEPPRRGPGSGKGAWVEFASLVSDMDEEVIDQLSRDELVQILIDRDVILAEEIVGEGGSATLDPAAEE